MRASARQSARFSSRDSVGWLIRSAPLSGARPTGDLQRRIGAQRVDVVAVLVAGRDHQHPRRRHLGVAVPDAGRIAIITPCCALGHRNDRGIDHLPAARDVALGFEMLAETLEQLLDQSGLRELLAEQPQRRAVGNAVLEAEPEKARERQPVAHLVLDLLVGQIVQRLQHQHPEHHDRVDRLAARGVTRCVQAHVAIVVIVILPPPAVRDCCRRR